MPIVKTSKEEILQKSMRLIWQKGYHDTSIGDLALALGMHKSHFYYYFKDKEDLMKEILLYMLAQFTQLLKRIEDNPELDTAGKLQKLATKIERFYDLDGFSNGCLMANTALESVGKNYAFMPVVRTFFSTFIEHLGAIYAEKYPEPEARTLAVRAVQEIEGAILLTRIFGEKTYLLQAIQRLVV